MCFHLNGDLTEKHRQIPHFDQNPANFAEDNTASDLNATPLFARPLKINAGADKRRAAKLRENATRPGRLPGDHLGHGSAQPRRLRPLFSQSARKGADKVAVSIAAKHFEASEASLTKARAIISDSALL